MELFYQQIVTIFGSFTLIMVLLFWIARTIFVTCLSKDIEKYKSMLQIEADRKRIQFDDLHEKQAEILAGVFSKISVIFSYLDSCSSLNISEDILDVGSAQYQFQQAKEAYSDANELFVGKEIYFDPDLTDLIEDVFFIMKHNLFFSDDNKFIEDWDKNTFDHFTKEWNKLSPKIEKVKKDLRFQFRETLGVLNDQS